MESQERGEYEVGREAEGWGGGHQAGEVAGVN